MDKLENKEQILSLNVPGSCPAMTNNRPLSLRTQISLSGAKGQLLELHIRILCCNIQFLGLHDFKISHAFLTKLNEALNLQIPLMELVLHGQSTLCQEKYS